MDTQSTCPVCNTPVDSTMKFCRSCGTNLNAEKAQPAPPAPPASPVPTCPVCKVQVKPGQKFCQKCGTKIEADGMPQSQSAHTAPSMVPPASTPNASGTGAATAAAAAASAAGSINDMAARSKSAIDDFMGRSVDTSNVGANFNSRAHTLQAAGNAGLKEAFAYFGKTYTAASPNEGVQPVPNVVRRAKADEEMRAQEQAKRDFSKTSGEGAHYGGFAASLSDAAMPTIDMIAGSRAKAEKIERLKRLQHQIAVGETTAEEALNRA